MLGGTGVEALGLDWIVGTGLAGGRLEVWVAEGFLCVVGWLPETSVESTKVVEI